MLDISYTHLLQLQQVGISDGAVTEKPMCVFGGILSKEDICLTAGQFEILQYIKTQFQLKVSC